MSDPEAIATRLAVSAEDMAGALDRVADLLEVQGAGLHRVRAWRHGAALVRESGLPPAQIASRAERGEIPGVGPRLASAMAELARTGRLAMLERLEGTVSPEERFSSVAGIGPTLAKRIHNQLGIATLEELEQAAHDGRLARVPGFGSRRIRAVQELLGFLLSASSRRRTRSASRPETAPYPRSIAIDPPHIALLLAVDEHYRREVAAGRLHLIAPRRFNPSGAAWLPILHLDRDGWSFTALYSNTARAHALGRTRDWVVIFCERDGGERQCTVVTEIAGPLKGRRVVRGREEECRRHYAIDRQTAPPPAAEAPVKWKCEDVMPRFVRFLGLALALGVSPGGCATHRASQARLRPAQVRLLDERPLTDRQSIRQIQTFACTRDAASEPDVAVARSDLRIEAARLGGDVVGNIGCHEADPRHHPDCWRVARCTGDVFRTH